jgi:hypothetical protein
MLEEDHSVGPNVLCEQAQINIPRPWKKRKKRKQGAKDKGAARKQKNIERAVAHAARSSSCLRVVRPVHPSMIEEDHSVGPNVSSATSWAYIN